MEFDQRPDQILTSAQARILESVAEQEHDPYVFLCANGVKLALQKVPSNLLVQLFRSIPEPEVPTFFDENAGRTRENLDDPSYQRALGNRNMEIGILTMNLTFGRGTKVIHIPDDVPKPDDDEWVEDIAELSNGVISIPKTRMARYATWLTAVVLGDDESSRLMDAIQALSGTPKEVDVAQVQQMFPGADKTFGLATNGVSSTSESEDEPNI